jgi:hypothetical protein
MLLRPVSRESAQQMPALRLTGLKTASAGEIRTLVSLASPVTIPINRSSMIRRPTIHDACNATSISEEQRQPPTTLVRLVA